MKRKCEGRAVQYTVTEKEKHKDKESRTFN
jgi:hypothetical protein